MIEAFGKRLREERLRLGLDQPTFAALGGVKKNSQISYEQGSTSPQVDYLYKLQSHGVDAGYVFTGRRGDGSLGFVEQQLVDMLAKLSMREREAVFALVSHLAGAMVGFDDLHAQSDRRYTLQSPARDFKND